MTFADGDSYVAAFPLDQSPDDASSPEMNYPTIKSSNTPLSFLSSPHCDGHSANSSSLGFINSHTFDPSYFHQVELAKITEYETWSISHPIDTQRSAKDAPLSYPPTLSSYQQDGLPSLTQKTSQRRLPLARANSGSGKPPSRASSSQSHSHPKRRMTVSGKPNVSPSSPTVDSGCPMEEVMTEPKPKGPAKISHSTTERRYRENINSKLLQLDQTLSSARILKIQSQKSEAQDDEQGVETPVKARKADILNEAMRYVKQAEHDSEAKNKEIDFLRLRLAALEKLVNCGDCALLKQFAGQQVNFLTDF